MAIRTKLRGGTLCGVSSRIVTMEVLLLEAATFTVTKFVALPSQVIRFVEICGRYSTSTGGVRHTKLEFSPVSCRRLRPAQAGNGSFVEAPIPLVVAGAAFHHPFRAEGRAADLKTRLPVVVAVHKQVRVEVRERRGIGE